MKKKLAIVIMAHPSRQDWAEQLSEILNAPIVYDGIANIWDTCRRSWLEGMKLDAEYVLVLQDDAIVCSDFIRRAEGIIARQDRLGNDFVYSFYAGGMLTDRIKEAVHHCEESVITGFIYNEVALCMKTEHIEGMVKFCDERNAHNDQLITKWTEIKLLKIFHTIPSLVDHRDGESLYRKMHGQPQSEKPRKAVYFAD